MSRAPRSVGELLRLRAESSPEARAYAFLGDGEELSDALTYAQLDLGAGRVARGLRERVEPGARALLLFAPGLEFLAAFFGCLYSGTVAVPAHPPDPSAGPVGLERLRAIALDARLSVVLTTSAIRDLAEGLLFHAPELSRIPWLAVDELSGPPDPPRLGGGLAFLQYTSGSTGAPKGVRVTHANLLHNLEYGNTVEGNDRDSVSVSWLPMAHDMGLIEGTLLPVFGGYPAYLMPPHAFLQRPARWLEAISRFRATNSGGPNFAFERCVRKVKPDGLDLSSWRVAYNGAEPIRADTLRRFHQTFRSCGLRWRALFPVYGLAEATLVVTSGRQHTEPRVERFEVEALKDGLALPAGGGVELVGAGYPSCGMEVRIVSPSTLAELPPGTTGEIWLRGPSVADGYWDKPQLSKEIFEARMANGEAPFLRTGDLGFLDGGELFVTGRTKDVIVVRGKKHHPHDLERTVEAASDAIRPGCSAAFSVEDATLGTEAAGLVAEVDPARLDRPLEALVTLLREAVAAAHGIELREVGLVPPRTVLKTSSGKLMRQACRALLRSDESGRFLHRSLAAPRAEPVLAAPAGREGGPGGAAETLAAWLAVAVAEQLGVAPERIDRARPVKDQGLDSLGTVVLLEALGERVGRQIPIEALTAHPDLDALARFVTAESTPSEAGPRDRELAVMRSDGALAPGVRPPATAAGAGAPFLLTGATGSLGAHLLRELLDRTDREVICLVRAADQTSGARRIVEALAQAGLSDAAVATRVRAVRCELERPGLGLDQGTWRSLAEEAGPVLHAAAAVNWVFPYQALRGPNVEATRELLRLACQRRAKPFHFVSTQLVCLTQQPGPPREVTDAEDLFGELEALHLGYAQTKCVAERLVRTAGERGLPVRIHRPPFLFGNAGTGRCSADDFLAALLKGCIALGAAPDLDWELDCCPLEHASAQIVGAALESPARGTRTFHPPLGRARHFRECVLWMNLFGYAVELTPHARWLELLAARATSPEHPLFFLRSFFLGRVERAGGLTRPELYETSRRNRVVASASKEPPAARLDAHLLGRYFEDWIRRGHLAGPPGARPRRPATAAKPPQLQERVVEQLGRAGHQVSGIELVSCANDHGLTTELVSWRHGREIGLFRFRLSTPGGVARTIVVKSKATDAEIVDVAEQLGRQCSARLGAAIARHHAALGFGRCHEREGAVYAQRDPRFVAHVPGVVFVAPQGDEGRALVALEDVAGGWHSGDGARAGWTEDRRSAALRGAAELHAIGYRQAAAWADVPVVSPVPAGSAAELWEALEENARPFFAAAAGAELTALHQSLVASAHAVSAAVEAQPATLIHNDFNARNIVLRRGDPPRLCALDWELATWGPPQRDVVELLAFTIEDDTPDEHLHRAIELHREALERATCAQLDRAAWRSGVSASIAQWLVQRLPLYTLIHRFQRLAWLPRVVRATARLHTAFPFETRARRRLPAEAGASSLVGTR